MSAYVVTTTNPPIFVRREIEDDVDFVQQDVADLVSDLCDAHYRKTSDWTGRKTTVNGLLDAVYALPEKGGTVGPLPDGTLISIEVRA